MSLSFTTPTQVFLFLCFALVLFWVFSAVITHAVVATKLYVVQRFMRKCYTQEVLKTEQEKEES